MQATSSFHATITLPALNGKTLTVHIKQGQNVKDVVYHLVQTYKIPPYLTTTVHSLILSVLRDQTIPPPSPRKGDSNMKQEKQSNNTDTDSKHRQGLRNAFMSAYQLHTLRYNKRPEEDIFPRAYHTLIHCPVSSIFDTLIELEQSYAIAIEELLTASDQELVQIQARQAQEIESASNPSNNNQLTVSSVSSLNSTHTNNSSNSSSHNNMTAIFARQVEEMELFQATWQSEIMQMQQIQRQEYREFVIELYKEYQSRLAALAEAEAAAETKENDDLRKSPKMMSTATATAATAAKLDGREMVIAAANRVGQFEEEGEGDNKVIVGEGSVKSELSSSRKSNSQQQQRKGRRPRTGSLASLGSSSYNKSSPSLLSTSPSPNELATLVRATSTTLNNNNGDYLEQDPAAKEAIKNIQEMGFVKEQAEVAYILSNQHMESAIALLLENPERVDAYMAEQKLQQQQLQQQQHFSQMARPPASSSTPYRRSHSLSQVPRPNIQQLKGAASSSSSSTSAPAHGTATTTGRRHSLQRFATTPTFSSLLGGIGGNKHQAQQQTSSAAGGGGGQRLSSIQNQQQQQQQQQKGWNPLSFLHQQKQALENTNLSSVRKLGGWLGKAMENLGIDQQANGGNTNTGHGTSTSLLLQQQKQNMGLPLLVESFSVMMGTAQIKSNHNLRLLVQDTHELFNPAIYDPAREMAFRAETATKLYNTSHHHLSAAIVIVELDELLGRKKKRHSAQDVVGNGSSHDDGWRMYKSGKGNNKALFERCQQSTEFHFATMESQLTRIEQDFREQGEENALGEGSFFITKHSNLPTTQIVFHLVMDTSSASHIDVSLSSSSKHRHHHPLLMGFRHILKMASEFDISSLSIPLLLLPDRWIEQPPHELLSSTSSNGNSHTSSAVNDVLYKRGEAIMKCIKGFLIENSRSNKRNNEDRATADGRGGGLRNVEFILPSRPDIFQSSILHTSSKMSQQQGPYTFDNASSTYSLQDTTSVSTTATTTTTPDIISPTPSHDASSTDDRIPKEVEKAFTHFRNLLVNLFRTN